MAMSLCEQHSLAQCRTMCYFLAPGVLWPWVLAWRIKIDPRGTSVDTLVHAPNNQEELVGEEVGVGNSSKKHVACGACVYSACW